MYWLGVDVGTGGTRALLVDESGAVRHAVTSPHEDMRMDRPMWAEQRPENWWEAAQQAIRSVLAGASIDGTQVKALGLSGQMHGLVMLDEANTVIRPSLIWCDQRSQAQVDFVHNTIGRENVTAATANPMITGFTLPKLLWVRDNEPHHFGRLQKILLPKDYIRFRLTGEYASDVADSSGTGLFDVVTRRWSKTMLEKLKLDAAMLPRVVESPEVTGTVSAAAAAATGLCEGTAVVGGAGDQAASAVGNGIVFPGVASCTLGTSGVVFAHLDRPNYDKQGRVHTFCHAVPGKWHVMGVTQGAGLSLQWMRKTLMPGTDYDAMTAEAAESPVGAHGAFWLPYLMGERTPHLDAGARGGWIGLTAKHTRPDLIRALLEGVSFSQRDCLELIEEMGVEVNAVRLSGGGARSALWRRILADVLSKRVTTLATQEGSAYGAALLAMAGSGAFSSVEEACGAVIEETAVTDPVAHSSQLYDRQYQVYTRFYPALRGIYSLINGLD